MKMILFSDIHLDAVTAGKPRLEELEAFLKNIVAATRDIKPDVVAFLGDAFDPGPGESKFSAILAHYQRQLRSEFFGTTMWIAGNHDVTEDVWNDRPVTMLSPLREFIDGEDMEDYCRVAELPVFTTAASTGFLLLPHVSATMRNRPEYAEWLDDAFDQAEHWTTEPNRQLVVLGHLNFDGMHGGSESEEMARGRDMLFPVERVAALKPDFVANGHYHARDVIKRGGLDIHIVGAPIHMTFGERHSGPRGYLVVEI